MVFECSIHLAQLHIATGGASDGARLRRISALNSAPAAQLKPEHAHSTHSEILPLAWCAELAENLVVEYKKHEAEDLRVPPEELAGEHTAVRACMIAGPAAAASVTSSSPAGRAPVFLPSCEQLPLSVLAPEVMCRTPRPLRC